MRAITMGVGVTEETELTVALAGADADSILRITQGGPGGDTPAMVDGAWTVTLSPGDYLVTVESEAQPHTDNPLIIRASAPVSFMSAQAEAEATRRSLVAWSATELAVDAPGWPRPPATVPLARAGFLDGSPIRDAMLTLADAAPDGAEPPVVHALLVGIDDYSRGAGRDDALYRSLRGCVRDILEVERFLLLDASVPRARITRLLAPAGASGTEAAEPATLPTYANIVAAWRAIIEAAQPGDLLYIHYAGHGGRARTLFPAIKRDGKLDESIAPCDINDRAAGKYLRDVEIAALLTRSANKGVLTTLVLDCCFSGPAARGSEAQARRGDADDLAPRADRLATSLVDSAAGLARTVRQLEHSPRSDDAWRLDDKINKSPFTIALAACRHHEAAYEYDVDGIHRQGALTYFWLEALRQRHAALTYRDAHRRVFAGVQGIFASQSPLFLGVGDRLVLGSARRAQAASIAVLDVDGDRIRLAAGASASLDKGTRLAIVPREVVPELEELSRMAQAEVIRAGETESTAARIAAGTGTGTGASPTPGAQALVVSYAPRMQRNVRLLVDQPSTEASAALAELESQIARDTTKLLAVDPTRGADYQVAIDRSPGTGAPVFSILDPAGLALPFLPQEIAIADAEASRRVKDRLVHLARFTNVLNLTNGDARSTLANKIALTLHAERDGKRDPDPLPVRPTLEAGTYFYIRIENRSMRPLISALFDLSSDRRIEMFAQTWELDPGQARDIRIKATLRPGHTAITDVLKVIATRSVVSFDWMTLPPLDSPVTRGGVTAHKRSPSNPFEALMKSMQAPPVATRVLDGAPSRDWTEARAIVDVVERG
jgi:hypothetical protein